MRCSAGSGFFMVLVGSVSTRGQSVESANKWPLIVVYVLVVSQQLEGGHRNIYIYICLLV